MARWKCGAGAERSAQPHAEVRDGVHEVVRRDLDFPGPPRLREARQDLPVRLLKLDLRYALAQPHVRAVGR